MADDEMVVVNGIRYRREDAPAPVAEPPARKGKDDDEKKEPQRKQRRPRNKARPPEADKADTPKE